MLYMVIASLALLAAGVFVSYMEWTRFDNLARMLFGFFLMVVGAVAATFCAGAGVSYQGAQYKADIINREYGTNYSQQEVFYASDVINIVRELNRNRYEINGDFRRQRDPQRNLRPEEKQN